MKDLFYLTLVLAFMPAIVVEWIVVIKALIDYIEQEKE